MTNYHLRVRSLLMLASERSTLSLRAKEHRGSVPWQRRKASRCLDFCFDSTKATYLWVKKYFELKPRNKFIYTYISIVKENI